MNGPALVGVGPICASAEAKENDLAKTTGIHWADATWNPWMGCAKVSEGCKNCYAERDMEKFGRDFGTPTRSKTTFYDPLKWKEPRRIFVCSWSDFFLETVPQGWREDAWGTMYQAPQHTYLLLTKRPQNIAGMLPQDDLAPAWPWPNVCLGVSAENQRRANERIPLLLQVPAAVHFVSAEPLLGPIDFLGPWYDWLSGWTTEAESDRRGDPIPIQVQIDRLTWIITGGESDPTAPRPMELDWARSIRDQCQEAGVAYFHKQNGGRRKIDGAWGGRELDGRTWSEFPKIE
jgi:protein gp37